MNRSRARLPQRVLGWSAIGLALAWSLFAQLLWQVETRQATNQPAEVRLVVSALAPSNHGTLDTRGNQTTKPHSASAQPVLPDGEAPTPCQLRRSLSTDVEVLFAPQTPSALIPTDRPFIGAEVCISLLCSTAADGMPHTQPPPRAGLPRPPPSLV